jgi:hypothetical protein
MTSILEKSTRHSLWRIRTLALIISAVLIFGSTPVFARGGGHSGGHGGHGGHHGGHTGDKHGPITTGTTARHHFTNQNPCTPTDKISEDCAKLDEKQLQTDKIEWHSR